MSQTDRIAVILLRDGQIDNFYCIHNRITLRLAARIYDLKKRGWEFTQEEDEKGNTIYRVTKEPAPEPLQLFT